jgi:soluble lytic murein transglycosylase-like protein
MRIPKWVYFAGLAGLAYAWTRRPNITAPDAPGGSDAVSSNPIASISEALVSLASWKLVGSGATWVPALNEAETAHGIPTDLLARMAYQESHFRDSIIRGTVVSSAGALGILQMLPQYFTSVRAPRPYTDTDVLAQIEEAAGQLVSLHESTGSWPLAIAAYNAGLGNVQKYGGIPPFSETQTYVAQVLADVPGASA